MNRERSLPHSSTSDRGSGRVKRSQKRATEVQTMEPITKYAILLRTTEMPQYISDELLPNGGDGSEPPAAVAKVAGTLLKLYHSAATTSSLSGSGRGPAGGGAWSIVQILDFVHKLPQYENLFKCPHTNLLKVSEDFWPYIISIAQPERRLHVAHNQELQHFGIYLKINDMVCVSGEQFGRKNVRYDCIVRFIGPVQELYPVGYFFGLELLHLSNGESPQADQIPFAITYLQCEPNLSIFTTIDWISPLSHDPKKKFSTLGLVTDALDKVRTVIAPGGCLSHTTATPASPFAPTNAPIFSQSQHPRKAKKQKTATAQFYTGDGNTSVSAAGAAATPTSTLRRLQLPRRTPSPIDGDFDALTVSGQTVSKTTPPATMERKGNQMGDGMHTQALIVMENDDFKQSVENYERTLERQHAITTTTAAATSNASSQTVMPTGILKHRNAGMNNLGGTTSASSTATHSTNNTNKPLIMSLPDRDLLVIDNADICESTRNEGSVIVVNRQPPSFASVAATGVVGVGTRSARQQDVDLAELLGSDWPHTAGNAAAILNKNSIIHHDNSGGNSTANSGSAYSTIERNKSPNPLQHIVATTNNNNNNNNNISNTLTRKTHERNKRDIGIGTSGSDANNKASQSSRPNSLGADAPIYDNLIDLIDTDAVPEDYVACSPLQEVPNGNGLGVGSMVEVSVPHTSHDIFGVIRWIGVPPGAKITMVGIELEEDQSDKKMLTTDGSFDGVLLFKCPEGRALFVTPDRCASDKRFLDMDNSGAMGGGGYMPAGAAALSFSTANASTSTGHHLHGEHNGVSGSAGKLNGNKQADCKMFGQVECPSVPGAVAPLKLFNLDELTEICGKFKGIQGHHNSCYLDATLFAMFTFTSVFDSLLFRPPDSEDISHYLEVQKVLREEVVNPLRKNMFVRADRVMKLRKLLDKLSSISGLTSEEKDPEEFLNSLLAQIMRVEPFLKLSSGQDAYFYQLFVEKDERLTFPTVQQLFEQSFHSSDIKLREVPSCLIIQMPRFGKNFKMYPRILPSQVLDVTDIIEDSPRQCTVCGKLAEYECRDCFGDLQRAAGLESTAFCRNCLETVHMHAKRANHTSKPLSVPQDFRIMAEHMPGVSRLFMELFAVVCIETSHYVAFVKAGSGPDAPWCFFDSMADRKGEKNGYNIPEMITVPDLPLWLSEEGARSVNETSANDKMLPEHAKRLFCDAYMCMYQSTDVMMYR